MPFDILLTVLVITPATDVITDITSAAITATNNIIAITWKITVLKYVATNAPIVIAVVVNLLIIPDAAVVIDSPSGISFGTPLSLLSCSTACCIVSAYFFTAFSAAFTISDVPADEAPAAASAPSAAVSVAVPAVSVAVLTFSA